MGSPAHAGIDPAPSRSTRIARRLPRARGDRPPGGAPVARGALAPPRTRGSTQRADVAARRAGGSPAHAGIDPVQAERGASASGLPRARGDRPPRRLQIAAFRDGLPRARGDRPSDDTITVPTPAAPPRTRGSTPHPHAAHRPEAGSPAHAGIDPGASWASRVQPGSPAHAGIDPRRCRGPRPRRRLPRARGDRPTSGRISWRERPAPPRTRGSTRTALAGSLFARGSPAHAGIDPPVTQPWLPTRWAPPRTRGSTLHAATTGLLVTGSPAHAGIDPAGTQLHGIRVRLPRARGDRPSTLVGELASKEAPPRTRGSTPVPDELGLRLVGSPAHAGIDPDMPGGAPSMPRLPRARGDRPSGFRRRRNRSEAPPRTRGSTLPDRSPPWIPPGSPAHAGIDPRICRLTA